MADKIKKVSNDGIYISLLKTFVARGVSSLGGLFLLIALARIYGPDGVGVFALAQSIFIGAGILARYGMNNALMRFVGEDYNSGHVVKYLTWGLKKSLLFSILISLFLFSIKDLLALWFEAPKLEIILIGLIFAIPPYVISFILSGFLKGIRYPAISNLLENGVVSLLSAIIIVIINNTVSDYGEEIIGWSVAFSAWIVMLFGLYVVLSWVRRQSFSLNKKYFSKQEFNSSSHAYFIMSIAQFMQTVLGVLIAAKLMDNTELGLFKSSERVALLIGLVLMVFNSIFPPRFATLFRNQDYLGLERLARKASLIGICFSTPLLLVCIIVPEFILNIFGDGFQGAEALLRIIACAQMINVATGSVGFVLTMTGHEKIMKNISLICNVIGLIAFLTLIPFYGALGAALALAFVLVLQNMVSLYFVWRCLGMWILPMPNFFCWVKTIKTNDNSL